MASLWENLSGFLFGRPERVQQIPTMGKQQRALYMQLMNALQGQGAGGAFGEASDYYRGLLDPSSEAYDRFAAPEVRRFQEDILPQLAEQFSAMGSGGALSGAGFRNAALREASSLSERLAAMRAGLQQQGAAGLTGIGNVGLQTQTFQPVMSRGSEGLLANFASNIGGGFGQALGVGAGDFGKYLSKRLQGLIGTEGGDI